MRAIFFVIGCMTLQIGSIAQGQPSDTIQTNSGPLIIRPVEHASLVLAINDKTIYIDPTGGAAAFNGVKAPDIVLVTDIHGDHHDQETINAVKNSNTILIVPRAVAEKIIDYDRSKLVILNNGKETKEAGISVTAIPMYNLPETADSRHTKGRGNGYVLRIGGKSIYISGDTEDIPEMRKLKNIDVAFICMNLPYTMDINQAASAVLDFKPKIVFPYHYRGQGGLSDVTAFKNLVNKGDATIEVRLRNWYPSK